MKTTLFILILLMALKAHSQCEMPYVNKVFTKIEYSTAVDGKLKVIKTTYSTNTFEILKNTSNTMGDMLALTGNLGKYVEFIREYECTYETLYTNYKFRVGSGPTDDLWIITILKNGALWSVANIRAKDNMVIKFVNQ